MKKIRILIVDDHVLVRLGLVTLLGDQPNMEVVGEASNAQDALLATERLQPDVVLMDIRMPGESGIDATRQITSRFPQVKVIILTSYTDDELVMRAIQAGAVGYVLKQADNDDLLRAVSAAARNEAVLDPGTTARLLSRVKEMDRQINQNAFQDLSDRELGVLAQLTRGKTNIEIAQVLNLSEKTVRNHVSTILEKLNLTNRVELATFAMEHHIFDQSHSD
jgi:two-component system, NarL family, response regulator DevR